MCRRFLAAFCLSCLSVTPALAVKKGEARFMGGTIRSIADGAEGPIDLSNQTRLIFMVKRSLALEIPWKSVTRMEYGQGENARRWRSAVLLLSPLGVFHKAKKHFVALTYKDATKSTQAVVLEFDNDDIPMVLASLEARTGKSIVMQDEETEKGRAGAAKKK